MIPVRHLLLQLRARRIPSGQRGFALLMALILVELITGFVTDFNNNKQGHWYRVL